MANHLQPTFYIFDYETFGQSPAFDRPAQFAGIRVDLDFNPLGDPLTLYCQPANDYLPSAEAVLITGITPQYALQHGVTECEFAQQIHQAFSQPYTCSLGYNNIRFDDEFSRFLFYRNFLDPYAHHWQHHNSRWDLLDVVRTCCALRPQGINWPTNNEGKPSLKLEDLTRANSLTHEQAHDALSDVYATIAIAKLIKTAQPKLFNYLFELRQKATVSALIDIVNMTPLVHISGMFGAARHSISLVAPIAWHPHQTHSVILCDLAQDISPLFTLSATELRSRLYTPHHQLTDEQLPIPLKLAHVNKCPVLVPLNVLRPEDEARLSLDKTACLARLAQLKRDPSLRQRITEVFANEPQPTRHQDVDVQLYQAFFSKADQAMMARILHTQPHQLAQLDLSHYDPRLKPLLLRFRARNYPNTLSLSEQHLWQIHRQDKLHQTYLDNYLHTLNDLAERYQHDHAKSALLKALLDYMHYVLN